MSSKVTITGFKDAKGKAKKLLEESLKDPNLLKEVGDLVHKNMTLSLRRGQDPTTRKTHSKDISEDYKKKRHELAQSNSTSSFYKKNRALVFTEQLIKSFKVTLKKDSVSITAEGIHLPYKDKDGRSTGKVVTNSNLARWLTEKGFTLFGFHSSTEKSAISLVKRFLTRKLKK